VFGREKKAEESFGVFRRLVVAQAKSEEILKACQDGGVVSALLLFALKSGLVDGAIVAGTSREKPFLPVPKLATTSEEIVECAGTKYCYSPNILALAEAVEQKKTSIAFVGTPCEVRAIRQMQMAGLRKFVAPVKFVIGLMCSECFTYEGLLKKHLGETLGLNLNNIRKINIKGKMLVKTESGVKIIPLTDAKRYARESCRFCDDFSSELADISAGGLGLDGWTFAVLRTEKGEELFSKAEKTGILNVKTVESENNALNLLNKLSKKKREAYPIS
jgi:coenzyme F420 hydrogenase subunit beta